ncbi:hypothetical protein C1701_03355 [Actinoalloteichus sp. AHMU CJ021]|uniref:hypothetical protein n=1 Tax=Actinoalloteichus TaxID=65496 RepID=UPI000CA02D25|nr:hypothetical protein C1701_03355 [Actinoalloteichus sp. AHMU CJ021]
METNWGARRRVLGALGAVLGTGAVGVLFWWAGVFWPHLSVEVVGVSGTDAPALELEVANEGPLETVVRRVTWAGAEPRAEEPPSEVGVIAAGGAARVALPLTGCPPSEGGGVEVLASAPALGMNVLEFPLVVPEAVLAEVDPAGPCAE